MRITTLKLTEKDAAALRADYPLLVERGDVALVLDAEAAYLLEGAIRLLASRDAETATGARMVDALKSAAAGMAHYRGAL